jgi:hypothetical protein
MSRPVAHCLLLALLCTAGVAHAGVVYVPLPPVPDNLAGTYETRVSIQNDSPAAQSFERVLLAPALPGALQKSRLTVAAGAASELRLPGSAAGMLQVSTDAASLRPTARLVGQDPKQQAVDLPVITAADGFEGGQRLALEGLLASASVTTNLALVNLAKTDNRCTLALATADGTSLGPATSFMLRGEENRSFLNLFERVIEPGSVVETAARASLSCEQSFYSYALVADGISGRLDVVEPQEDSLPEDRTKPTTVPTCPAGAICFDAPGVVNIPVPPPGFPVARVTFPAPAGVAKRFLLSIDVTVANWYKPDPAGKNLIYWFVVNKNIDMPGLLYFLGPNKYEAFARHGMGLKHPQKIKVIKPFAAQIGHTYHVVNDYNMAGQTYTVTVTDKGTGKVPVTLHSRPNVTTYTVKPGSNFLIDTCFYPGKVPTEVPSYGWTYANVHVEAYMQ